MEIFLPSVSGVAKVTGFFGEVVVTRLVCAFAHKETINKDVTSIILLMLFNKFER